MEIELPNGQIAEFPDTMTHDEIVSVLQKQFPQQAKQSDGIGSIPGDIGKAGLNMLMKGGEKVMKLPQEISEAAKQIYKNPLEGTGRAGLGMLSGLLEGGKQLYNSPLDMISYLGSKGLPPYKQLMNVAEKGKIGETGLQKSVIGEPKKGDELWKDIGEFAPMAILPERLGAELPALTSKGLMKQLSKQKEIQLGIAKKEYGNLFNDAKKQGLTHAMPNEAVIKNKDQIIENSIPRYHDSLKTYLDDPTIENAHWAQSELGHLKRYLDRISKKNGLTPSQIKTYKAVIDARNGIKSSMFSENALGKTPDMALRYQDISNKYKTDVLPYTSLEDLSEFESGKVRPKTAVKNLLNNEEFMINLAKKFPGIYLHTPLASKIGLGAAGLLGYDEIKRLLK